MGPRRLRERRERKKEEDGLKYYCLLLLLGPQRREGDERALEPLLPVLRYLGHDVNSVFLMEFTRALHCTPFLLLSSSLSER